MNGKIAIIPLYECFDNYVNIGKGGWERDSCLVEDLETLLAMDLAETLLARDRTLPARDLE